MEVYKITKENQLNDILISTKRLRFIFDFSSLTENENKYWNEKIKENYYACGCETGKYFMAFSFIFISFFLIYIYLFKNGYFNLNLIISSLVLIFVMAGAGKFIGKAIANKVLKKDISELKKLLTNGLPKTIKLSSCP